MELNDNDWDSFISHNIKKNQQAFVGLARILAEHIRLDEFLSWIITNEHVAHLRELETAKMRVAFFEQYQARINAFVSALCKQYMTVPSEWYSIQCGLDPNQPNQAVDEVFIHSNKQHVDYADLVDKVTTNIILGVAQQLNLWKLNECNAAA